MTCASEYVSKLHLRGFRVTSQRIAIHHLTGRECGSEIEVDHAIFKKVL
jgi:Fe2+ or Zn2+ uptake regulation protein